MFDPTRSFPPDAISGGTSAASLSSFLTLDRSDDGGVDVCVVPDVDPQAASPSTSSEVTSRRGIMAGTVQRSVEHVHKKLKFREWPRAPSGIPSASGPLNGGSPSKTRRTTWRRS